MFALQSVIMNQQKIKCNIKGYNLTIEKKYKIMFLM